MTKSKIRAVYSLTIWGAAALVFVGLFFLGGGPAAFTQSPLRVLVMALALLLGFALHGAMLRRTRLRPTDERDALIASRANTIALTAVLLFVFVVSVTLYEVYHDAGALPVGWMWFMAYVTSCFGYMAHAAAALWLHREMGGDV